MDGTVVELTRVADDGVYREDRPRFVDKDGRRYVDNGWTGHVRLCAATAEWEPDMPLSVNCPNLFIVDGEPYGGEFFDYDSCKWVSKEVK